MSNSFVTVNRSERFALKKVYEVEKPGVGAAGLLQLMKEASKLLSN